MSPDVPSEVLFQLLYAPAGDRMLFKHNRRHYSVLQVGMDVALSFPEACSVLLGTPWATLDLLRSLLAQAISCSNVHGVFTAHERYWFCLVQVSATQLSLLLRILLRFDGYRSRK